MHGQADVLGRAPRCRQRRRGANLVGAADESARKLIDILQISFGAAESDRAQPPRKRAQLGREFSLGHVSPDFLGLLETKRPAGRAGREIRNDGFIARFTRRVKQNVIAALTLEGGEPAADGKGRSFVLDWKIVASGQRWAN